MRCRGVNDSNNKGGGPFPRLALNMSPFVGANAFWQPADSLMSARSDFCINGSEQRIMSSNIKKKLRGQGNFLCRRVAKFFFYSTKALGFLISI